MDAIPGLGQTQGGAMDNGYFSATNIAAMEARDIEPYIATGRHPIIPVGSRILRSSPRHPQGGQSEGPDGLQTVNRDWQCDLPLAKMYSRAGYRHYQRHPGLSPILAAGLASVAGEWCLVCMAFNLKRLHTLTMR